MILPHSASTLIVLMVICLLCWGTWPVFYKLARKYRFELFYFDFGFGLGLVALVCAFTIGSLSFDGFSFVDDMMNARKQEWLAAALAAGIFNFGNMFTLASASVAGLWVAFPLSFGAAMIVGSWIEYFRHPGPNSALLFGGTLLVVLSAILGSLAYSHLRVLQHEALARAGKAASTRRPNSLKGILLALVGGLVMGAYGPFFSRAQNPDDGVGPYSLLFLFALGIFGSTFILNLFFMNLPVEGEPLEIADYIKTPIKNHLMGLAGGAVWGLGALATFVANTPKGDVRVTGSFGPILQQAAPIVVALWGWLMWKELKDGDLRVKAFAGLMLLLFAGGVTFFSFAAAPAR